MPEGATRAAVPRATALPDLDAWLRELERKARVLVRRVPGAKSSDPVVREAADDAVQHVLLACWRRATLGPPIENEDAFLFRAMSNYMVTVIRSRSRVRTLVDEDTAEPVADDSAEPVPDVETRMAEVKRVVSWAADEAIARRKPRYRLEAALAWGEIQGLVFDGRGFDEVVSEELRRSGTRSSPTAVDAERARLRLYKRHSRFRADMQAAVDAGARSGRLSGAEALRMGRCLMYLHRFGGPGRGEKVDRGSTNG